MHMGNLDMEKDLINCLRALIIPEVDLDLVVLIQIVCFQSIVCQHRVVAMELRYIVFYSHDIVVYMMGMQVS